jgi:two-component system, NarL family, invasion response regulator UvrY
MNRSIRLAIADDHGILRQGIIATAGRCNVEVVAEASNGSQLLRLISDLDSLPDICILDINMPVMNGYVTLSKIKSLWPQIPVLALSMHYTDFPIMKMLRGGACGYLIKDSAPELLCDAINAIMTDGYYISDISRAANRRLNKRDIISSGPRITDKEICFLSWCCCDLSYKEIATRMDISSRTVESYAKILCDKLDVNSRIGLVMTALSMGIEPAE